MTAPYARKKIVIVGGGFGGLAAAKALSAMDEFEITLLDRRNHHLFQPLLYQVATAALSPADIAAPIRSVLSKRKNVFVALDTVMGFDLAAHQVHGKAKTWAYDYLVIAAGASHSYFGHDDWEARAPGLKTIEQATEIRRRILSAFERAEIESSVEERRRLQTFVVIGAGPTGVELAGAISEIARQTLRQDFRHIEPARTRVILIEAGPRVLAAFDERLSKRAVRDLESLGVQVWTSTAVEDVTATGVRLAGGDIVQAETVLWAAGVKPSILGSGLGAPLDRAGRVIVRGDLSIEAHPEVFVLGDLAHVDDPKGKPLPGLAPVALQQGRYLGRLFRARLHGKELAPFRYIDKGQMATIGRRKAVAQTSGLRLGGFTAWLAWLAIHIYYLIGFRNRLFVMAQWTWSYLSFQRGARLIVNKDWQEVRK